MSSSTQFSKIFTTEFLRDVNSNPELVNFMKTIDRESFHTCPTSCDINMFVNFIYKYIDINELIKSPHATEWEAISVKADGSWVEQAQHIKSQMSDVVRKIITKQFHNKTVDNTFSNFIKRIICNVIGDVCGGFKITDLRPQSNENVDAMQYIRTNKQKDMKTYISDRLFKQENGGFVVCLENDHGCVFERSHWFSELKNAVYTRIDDTSQRKDTDSICYLQIGDCKGNQAKGIYYTGNYSVSEVKFEDVQQRMVDYGFTDHHKLITNYKDRFSVCCVHNTTETDNDDYKNTFWYKKKYFIILHNKSVGTKSDIKKNAEEYACMRKLIDSYATSNDSECSTKHDKEDVLVLGDFNLPLWGKDNGYLKLEPSDRKTYPIQEIYEDEHETFMTKNLELYSTWNNNDVGYKDRSADWMQNSQAGIGKRTIPEDGPRCYNTDMVFGNIKLNNDWGPTIIESKLYPESHYCECTKIAFPLVSPELTWFSDHQSMEMTMYDCEDSKTEFTLTVLNTLSDCCSGQQHMNRKFNKESLEQIRDELATLLVDYVHNSITFNGDIIENCEKTFKESDKIVQNDYDQETDFLLDHIMTHNEYNVAKALIITIMLNYMLWFGLAFIKWLFTNE